jgi:hypothetical protein
VFDEVEQKKEDCAVEELLAGQLPLLVCGHSCGKEHHEDRSAD